jgi:hypothetical protein
MMSNGTTITSNNKLGCACLDPLWARLYREPEYVIKEHSPSLTPSRG